MAFEPREFAALPGHPILGWWPTGTVDEPTVLTYYAKLATYAPAMHRYCDFSNVSEFSFGFHGLEKLARGRKASLATSEQVKLVMMSTSSLGFGMSRMYEALMAGFDMSIHVVRSSAEAAQLLGVAEAELAQPMLAAPSEEPA